VLVTVQLSMELRTVGLPTGFGQVPLTPGCNPVLACELVNIVFDTTSTAQQWLDAVLMAAILFVECGPRTRGAVCSPHRGSLARGSRNLPFHRAVDGQARDRPGM